MAIRRRSEFTRKLSGLRSLLRKKPAPLVKPTPSKMLAVFDVPMHLLMPSEENPNEQDEATFDQLVEGIRKDGFDEPLIVVPGGQGTPAHGKYIIVSGHHRWKAAKVIGMKACPAVIKEGWSDDQRKIELIRRNMLKGDMNPEKFTQLFNEMSRKYDKGLLKLQMGFTNEAVFKKIFKTVEKSLNPAQRTKLAAAKETITSVDGLSSALNTIFKEHGSELDNGFMVFTFGGKQHHFIEADKPLHDMMIKLEKEVQDKGLLMTDVFKNLLVRPDLTRVKPSPKVAERRDSRLKDT